MRRPKFMKALNIFNLTQKNLFWRSKTKSFFKFVILIFSISRKWDFIFIYIRFFTSFSRRKMFHIRVWLVFTCTCLDDWLSTRAIWYFVDCLNCYDFSRVFVRKWFSTTPFAVRSFPFLLCLSRTTTTTITFQNKKQSMKNMKVHTFKIYRRGFAAFDACCEFCHTDKLYESSRRKPGWRFTAGCEFRAKCIKLGC